MAITIGIMKQISNVIQKILEAILMVAGVLLIIVNIAQIGGRVIFFYSLPWSEQLSTWLFVWICFLGYHLVLVKDNELAIEVIQFSNPKKQLLLGVLRDLLSLVMVVVLFFSSCKFLSNAINFPQKLSSMNVYMYVIYAAMPVSFLIMAFQKFLNMFIKLAKSLGRYSEPDANALEG